MVERQPNRPLESELKGAVLRIQANDYWIQPTGHEGTQRAAAVVSLGIWVPRSLIRRASNYSSAPYFDQSWHDQDRQLLKLERDIEGINPDETWERFVDRKRQELLPKKD